MSTSSLICGGQVRRDNDGLLYVVCSLRSDHTVGAMARDSVLALCVQLSLVDLLAGDGGIAHTEVGCDTLRETTALLYDATLTNPWVAR